MAHTACMVGTASAVQLPFWSYRQDSLQRKSFRPWRRWRPAREEAAQQGVSDADAAAESSDA